MSLQPWPRRRTSARRPGFGIAGLVGVEFDRLDEGVDGLDVVAEPGPDQAEVEPRRRVRRGRRRRLLERPEGVGQPARRRFAEGGLGRGRQRPEVVAALGRVRQPRLGAEERLERLLELQVGRGGLLGPLQGGAGGDRLVGFEFEFADAGVDALEVRLGLGVEQLGRLAVEHERAQGFAFLLAHQAAEPVAEGEGRVQVERLLDGGVGLLGLLGHVQEFGVVAPRLRKLRLLDRQLGHGGEGLVLLAGPEQLLGLLDHAVDRLAAPLERLPAAARARGVRGE